MAANSLVPSGLARSSVPGAQSASARQPAQLSLRSDVVTTLEHQLESLYRRHLSVHTYHSKKRLQQEYRQVQAAMASALVTEGFDRNAAARVTTWDPFDPVGSASFFDPEWMFALPGGFDVVITNPPYVRQESLGAQKVAFSRDFPEVYTGRRTCTSTSSPAPTSCCGPAAWAASSAATSGCAPAMVRSCAACLLDAQAFHLVADFGDLPVFEATAYPAIFLWRKRPGTARPRPGPR